MNAKLDSKKARLEAVKRLRDNPDYQSVMIPYFIQMASHFSNMCSSVTPTHDPKVHNYAHATAFAKNLVTHLDTLAASLESTVKQIKSGEK